MDKFIINLDNWIYEKKKWRLKTYLKFIDVTICKKFNKWFLHIKKFNIYKKVELKSTNPILALEDAKIICENYFCGKKIK